MTNGDATSSTDVAALLRTLIRIEGALLVKGVPKPGAATQLLDLGVSPSDTAKILGIAQASVYVIRHRAKKARTTPEESQ